MISNQFHCRKRALWKFKKKLSKITRSPKILYFPSHLDASLNFVCECFPSVLDVLWGQWIYLKLSTESREHVRNNFGKIKNDLAPIIIGWRIEFFNVRVRVGILKYHTWGRRYVYILWILWCWIIFFELPKCPFPAMKLVPDHTLSFQNCSQNVS